MNATTCPECQREVRVSFQAASNGAAIYRMVRHQEWKVSATEGGRYQALCEGSNKRIKGSDVFFREVLPNE